MTARVLVTGAYGYLGAKLCQALEAGGWTVVRLVRSPRPGDRTAVAWSLGGAHGEPAMEAGDVLIHGAYDMSLIRPEDIRRVNVQGSRALVDSAVGSGVSRIIFISSMSAWPGTRQLYGKAKLEIEAVVLDAGGYVVRPGLIIGEPPGGMAGALQRLVRLPVAPLIGGSARQYPVSERDVISAIVGMAESPALDARIISVAAPAVPFREVLGSLRPPGRRRIVFVPVPWPAVYGGLRLAELFGVRLPFRADSLLGLVRPAPRAVGVASLDEIGIELQSLVAGSGRARG